MQQVDFLFQRCQCPFATLSDQVLYYKTFYNNNKLVRLSLFSHFSQSLSETWRLPERNGITKKLLQNVRLGWNELTVTNTLAYYGSLTITAITNLNIWQANIWRHYIQQNDTHHNESNCNTKTSIIYYWMSLCQLSLYWMFLCWMLLCQML
jgi:hypothetical protein